MTELRRTFDDVAELYHRARPRYPEAVFDDLIALARLKPGDKVLEIGPGTGLATLPLAERGLDITAVELGEGLAAVARRNLSPHPHVDLVVAPFETWDPGDRTFDAVVSFTALHWIDPALRYVKPASLLRPGGALGVVWTAHVMLDAGDQFFAEVQEDYDRVAPSPDNKPPPGPEEVSGYRDEILASGLFESVEERRHPWEVAYTADEYIELLDTFSGHRAYDEDTRARLYTRIRRRISARPGGIVRKPYVAILHVARRPA